jgi:hypothetical protein
MEKRTAIEGHCSGSYLGTFASPPKCLLLLPRDSDALFDSSRLHTGDVTIEQEGLVTKRVTDINHCTQRTVMAPSPGQMAGSNLV